MREPWIVNVEEFVESKIPIAKCLYEGACHGTYQEAAIILSATISAIAASAWPGYNIDKKRFVELCVQYSGLEVEAKKISFPILCQDLRNSKKPNELDELRQHLPEYFDCASPTYAFNGFTTGKDFDLFKGIDVFEHDLVSFSSLSPKELRKFSYAALFYEEIRCGYMHDYKEDSRASSYPVFVPHLKDQEALTCIHYHTGFKGVSQTRSSEIYFPYVWIEQLVTSIATFFGRNPTFPLIKPRSWWIEG